jgi:hypothetical protein
VGNFDNGMRSGEGTYIWQCGDKYEGSWHDDERSGFGILKYQNGSAYKGEWFRDQRSGWGEMNFSDGSSFLGEWWKNNICGKGVYTFTDGRCLQGEWNDGKLTNEFPVNTSNHSKMHLPMPPQSAHQSKSVSSLVITEKKSSSQRFRTFPTFVDLIFGRGPAHHEAVSRGGPLLIDREDTKHGCMRNLSFSYWSSFQVPGVEVGGKFVRQLFDTYHTNASKASIEVSQEQANHDKLCSVEKEHADLERRIQEMKNHLEQLLVALHSSSLDPSAQFDTIAETGVHVEVQNEETFILELTEQIEALTSENDALARDLCLPDMKSGADEDLEKLRISLSQEADDIASETAALKMDKVRAQHENAELRAKYLMIIEQNKSFQSALTFRSKLSIQNRQ